MTDPPALYTRTEAGTVACRLCHHRAYDHARECPVITLRLQVRELSAQLGLFVASMRETVEVCDRLLRGHGPDDPARG